MIQRELLRRLTPGSTSWPYTFSLAASFTTSQTTRQEIAPRQGSGLLSVLGFSEGSIGSTPMTDPFPGTIEPYRTPPPKEPAKTQLTSLANGFRVASEDTWVENGFTDRFLIHDRELRRVWRWLSLLEVKTRHTKRQVHLTLWIRHEQTSLQAFLTF